MEKDRLKKIAASNALMSVKNDVQFPSNVFMKNWRDYLFFEPYRMFELGFIDVKNAILQYEKSSLISIINVGSGTDIRDESISNVYLDKDIIWQEYEKMLKGDGSATNWMYMMDRYICTSNEGGWCIYCEKENDVAVFAVGGDLSSLLVSKIENMLRAKSIKSASSGHHDGGSFDFDKLLPAWRAELLNAYD